MRSTFFGLELGYKALTAQQAALDVTGHNISNAGTAGYTREIPTMVATEPYTINGVTGTKIAFGSGSAVDTVTRMRDQFVDREYRWESTKQQYWAGQQTSMDQIEGILNEPSDNSLRTDIDKFFSAWGTLANDPQNSGAKAVVQQRALALADTFHHTYQQLSDLRDSLDNNIGTEVKQINSYAEQIAQLNDQIKKGQVSGAQLNDLMDQRDSLIDSLSQLVSVQVTETQDPNFTDRNVGILKITIGDDPNQVLVNDSVNYKLADYTPPTSPAPPASPIPSDPGKVTWASGPAAGNTLSFGDKLGLLQSNLDMRNNNLTGPSGYMAQLDTLAQKLAEAVNDIYNQTAPTDTTKDFFTKGTSTLTDITAANITIADTINTNSDNIAAGSDPTNLPQDSSIAKEIASLATGWTTHADLSSDADLQGATSIEDYYGTIVAAIGVTSQTATRMKASQDVLVNNMSNQREQASGVSLDEEMTNLMKYQKSYSAAARIVTMMDELLDKVVNSMGVTR